MVWDGDNSYRIRTWQELMNWINEIGFLLLFAGGVEGFSAEEHTSLNYWRMGNRQKDSWEWRGIIAASGQAAYGKFFGNKAGFISLEWFPYFVNCRRNEYDFDARYQDSLASHRKKKIMEFFVGEDEDGDAVYRDERFLSTNLKKTAGFGKGGEKNYSGVITGLQMQTYLVIGDFVRRKNRWGEKYSIVYEFPLKLAVSIAVKTVSRFLEDNLDSFDIVEWILFDSATENVYDSGVRANISPSLVVMKIRLTEELCH